MLTPGSDHVCPGCSFIADHVDAARQHFEHAELSFAAVSRVPLRRIEEVKNRMGWTFSWVSSRDSDFNFDFGVSFTPEDIAAGRAIYNYGTVMRKSQDMFGASVFVKDCSCAGANTAGTAREFALTPPFDSFYQLMDLNAVSTAIGTSQHERPKH